MTVAVDEARKNGRDTDEQEAGPEVERRIEICLGRRQGSRDQGCNLESGERIGDDEHLISFWKLTPGI